MNRRDALKVGLAALLSTWMIAPARRRMIDLNKFCAPTNLHWKYDIASPFTQADWTYATDLRICVRVRPASADVIGEESRRPAAASLMWDHDSRRGWAPLGKPEALTAEGFCPTCDVTGWMDPVDCTKCDGEGCRQCKNSGSEGTVICRMCKGNPDGVFPWIAKVGDAHFDVRFVNKIASLGDSVEFVGGTKNPSDPMRFRFDGGTGLLMPVDVKYSKIVGRA